MRMALGQFQEFVHGSRQTVHVHGENGAGARRQAASDIGRISTERVRVNLTVHQSRPLPQDRQRRGLEVHRWADDLVVRLQVQGHHGHIQAHAGSAYRNRELCSAVRRESPLEGEDFLDHETESDAPVHRLTDGLDGSVHFGLCVPCA
ncbi:MAG: hypothetical protein NTW87_06530 [Planctomycetota bacterium]|nr:hypothetical protein [Planctomycetota bacterium]